MQSLFPHATDPAGRTRDIPARQRAAAVPTVATALALPLLGALAALAAATLMPAPLWTLLFFAPVIEEVVFRSGLQDSLLRLGGPRDARAALVANMVTALAFAAAHALAHSGALAWLTLLPSLLIGWVYQGQRRLDLCIALHLLFNATWLLWAGTPA